MFSFFFSFFTEVVLINIHFKNVQLFRTEKEKGKLFYIPGLGEM